MWIKVLLGIVVTTVILAVILRPRILLKPIVWAFAIRAWATLFASSFRAAVSLPILAAEWLREDTAARMAVAWNNHAQIALAMCASSTGATYKTIARKIFDRIAVDGYKLGGDGPPMGELNLMDDPGSTGAVIGAAAAVTASGGKRGVPLTAKPCRCGHALADHDERAGMFGACRVCVCAAGIADKPTDMKLTDIKAAR